MGLTLSCLEAIPMDLCGFRLVWLQPRFVLFRCFLCWRNANLAGRFAGRRCCRVFSCCFGVSMMCLGCEAKEFHIYLHTFLPLLSLSERDRPQQRKKKIALSLCQYVLRPRRGLGQVSPSLEAPRLQALEARNLFHQHTERERLS